MTKRQPSSAASAIADLDISAETAGALTASRPKLTDETHSASSSSAPPDAVHEVRDADLTATSETNEATAVAPDELTRYTTPEERASIDHIELDALEVERFIQMLRSGLLQAAHAHTTAVQRNFALSAETTIRLSRPVRSVDGSTIETIEGTTTVKGQLRAEKIYKDDSSKS